MKGYFIEIEINFRDCKYSKFAENGEVFYLFLAKAERCKKRENGRVTEGLKQKTHQDVAYL
jgi:hypothetical protein